MIRTFVCMTAMVLAAPPVAHPAPETPSDPPATFTAEVSLAGRFARLDLTRHDVRAPNARLRVYGAQGLVQHDTLPPVSTYRGTVAGQPGSVALASVQADGLHARILVGDETWTLDPAIDAHGARRDEGTWADFPDSCGAHAAMPRSHGPPSRHAAGSDCLALAEIAFDADFEYYQLKGSSIPNVIAAIDAHMNLVDFYYARDVQITYALTAYVVRTAPFYDPVSGGDLLDQFRAEWNANHTDVVRDIAHLMTDKPGEIIEYGGLAWVGVVCTTSGYGWSRDNTFALGHEIGHNWGAGHCHDLSPCNNMCGGCLNVAPNTRDIMIAHRDSRTCLDPVPPYADPLPPYAYPESLTFFKNHFDDIGQPAFDVLDNDDDGNCDPLSIDGFDTASALGGSVSLSPGTGPDGRDELVYTPPASPFIGADTFGYTVGDGTGQQTVGTVAVHVRPRTLVGYWPLNDGSGSGAVDATINGRDGTLVGTPTWFDGIDGAALIFEGTSDSVTISPLDLRTQHITITAWINRSGSQDPFSGLVFTRDGSSVAGLHFGNNNELRYSWNDASNTWGWNSGLVVPNNTWVFVALVVEPQSATLYLHDGVLQSASNVIDHAVEEFDGVLTLASDPGSAARFFAGMLDEVRVYDHAMTAGEIATLHASGGRADSPLPRDGGQLIAGAEPLRWLPGLLAESHDVYFGTNFETVRNADTGAPEFRVNTTALSYNTGPVLPDTTYYWRVDEHVGQGVIPGDVWQFTLGRFSHWTLDEPSGTLAADSAAGFDGTYVGGPLLGQPGATPGLGNAVRLDGFNDRVLIPALNLLTTEATITAWVRRIGDQSSFTGLVFSRAGNTAAGLNVHYDNELGYHWNNTSSTWDWASGLFVPEDTWTFVALALEPNRATLYMSNNGVLVSAVNTVFHELEEFDGNLEIGRDSLGGRQFDGLIDDVRVYDTAFVRSQIQALYDESQGCVELADCADPDGDGIRNDGCVWWACADGLCAGTAVQFADLGGANGSCLPDGTPDASDLFHALNCFSDQDTTGPGNPYPCEVNPPVAYNVDAGGQFGSCNPDGVCDANDAFAALNAFSGSTTCSCPSGSPAPNFEPRTVGRADLELVPRESVFEPGGLLVVDVHSATAMKDLRGYQLHLGTTGGQEGDLELLDIATENRLDRVFAGEGDWQAFNVRTGQMVAGLTQPGVPTSAGAYLATFTYRVSPDASGKFALEILHDDNDASQRTFLFPTPSSGRIEISSQPVRVLVGPARARSGSWK